MNASWFTVAAELADASSADRAVALLVDSGIEAYPRRGAAATSDPSGEPENPAIEILVRNGELERAKALLKRFADRQVPP